MVITDSNRRRRFVPEFGHQNLGRHPPGDEPIDENFALIEPFPERGGDAQTVAALEGARYLRAPNSGGLLEFPECGAIAAFDGDPETVWAADRYLHPRERWIEIGFERPRDVPYVDLLPLRDWRGIETEVDVSGSGRRLGPGRNRLRWASRTWLAADHDHGCRPAAGRPARQRRLPGDPHPRREPAPAAAAAGAGGARAGRAAT